MLAERMSEGRGAFRDEIEGVCSGKWSSPTSIVPFRALAEMIALG
jgi:hypothetical protein